MANVAAIQMTSSASIETNLKTITRLVAQSAKQGAQLVVLPENAVFIGENEIDKFHFKEKAGNGPIQSFMSKLAEQYGIWLVAGTIPIASEIDQRIFASCWIWDNYGKVVARYDKIHLFDVTINSTEYYFESQTISPGKDIVSVDSPFGKLGLTICYDLRFPELYRALLRQGVEIIMVPSAFTETTGQAHWEPLLRARAIENFCYVIASNQDGVHANGRTTYGHTMIIDPWGKILNSLKEGEGVVMANIDLAYLKDIRNRFPTLTHIKIF